MKTEKNKIVILVANGKIMQVYISPEIKDSTEIIIHDENKLVSEMRTLKQRDTIFNNRISGLTLASI